MNNSNVEDTLMHVTTTQFMIWMLIALLFGLYVAAFGQSNVPIPNEDVVPTYEERLVEEPREGTGGMMTVGRDIECFDEAIAMRCEVSSAYRQCYERLYAMLRRVTREDPALSRALQIYRDLRQGGLRITEPTYRDAESEAVWQLEQIRAEKRRDVEIDTLLTECQPQERHQ